MEVLGSALIGRAGTPYMTPRASLSTETPKGHACLGSIFSRKQKSLIHSFHFLILIINFFLNI